MIDDASQIRPAAHQILSRELAFENRVLQMIPVVAHSLKDFAQALVIADVVADQIGVAHRFTRTRASRRMLSILQPSPAPPVQASSGLGFKHLPRQMPPATIKAEESDGLD